MYVDVLSGALETWTGEQSGNALVDHVVACRVHLLLTTRTSQGRSTYDFLAAEVAYDRGLIRLCQDVGVMTSVANFADPRSERSRLEDLLTAQAGIDLPALARKRAAHSGH